MSEFLLLFRGGDPGHNLVPAEQAQAHMQRWIQWMTDLAEQGRMVSAEPLDPGGRTVSGTAKVVTDGPFIEGKEMVSGYLILLAESIDAATTIAKDCPIFEFEDGNVEVRPINKIEM